MLQIIAVQVRARANEFRSTRLASETEASLDLEARSDKAGRIVAQAGATCQRTIAWRTFHESETGISGSGDGRVDEFHGRGMVALPPSTGNLSQMIGKRRESVKTMCLTRKCRP